jgi:hypothetical protein
VRARRGSAPGERDDRQAADVGLGDAREQVGGARAGGHQADARLAGELSVGGGHAGGGVLVADEHVADRRGLVERVVDAQDVAARQPVDVVDALGLEHVHDRSSCCAR